MERLSEYKRVIAIGAAIAVVGLILLMSWLRPGVPKEVSILAGPQSSRSYQWAERYADYVETHGIHAKIISTAGSGDILRRLSDGTKPALAFCNPVSSERSAMGSHRRAWSHWAVCISNPLGCW